MKNLLLVLSICVAVLSYAQITPVRPLRNLENAYGTPPYVVHLTNYGDKYVEIHGRYTYTPGISHPAPDTMFIWNSDFTPFKTIILQDTASYFYNVYNPNSLSNIPAVTDNLFNSDSSLEYIIQNGSGYLKVVSEQGNTLLSSINRLRLIKMNDSFYAATDSMLYSLPGTIPCIQCSGISTGLSNLSNGEDKNLTVYPNPFNQTLNIRYSFSSLADNANLVVTDMLGRELKRIPLTNQVDDVNLDTSGFSAGTIIISIYNGTSPHAVSTKAVKIN